MLWMLFQISAIYKLLQKTWIHCWDAFTKKRGGQKIIRSVKIISYINRTRKRRYRGQSIIQLILLWPIYARRGARNKLAIDIDPSSIDSGINFLFLFLFPTQLAFFDCILIQQDGTKLWVALDARVAHRWVAPSQEILQEDWTQVRRDDDTSSSCPFYAIFRKNMTRDKSISSFNWSRNCSKWFLYWWICSR